MKKNLLFTLFSMLPLLFNSQTVSLISEQSGKPLAKVILFDSKGNIVATSDSNGNIGKENLIPSQEKYELVYNSLPIASLTYSDFEKDVIKLNDKVTEIQPILIKGNKSEKYSYLRGYFNAYVTLNNKLYGYADGIAVYTIDNKTQKIKDINTEQYRVYRMTNQDYRGKELSAKDHGESLKLISLKYTEDIDRYKNIYKEDKVQKGDFIEIDSEVSKENGESWGMFEYRFQKIKSSYSMTYEVNSEKKIKNLLEYNYFLYSEVKHKSEPEFNAFTSYFNFYPYEMIYTQQDKNGMVKFNKNHSNYTTDFWKEPGFPNMQTIFSSFFKDDLKEQENTSKK